MKPQGAMEIKFLDFSYMHQPLKEQMAKKFEQVYDSSYFIMGKEVEEFQKNYAKFSGTKFCVGVANGLDALILALRVLNIGKGDQVIVPSNTYIASWLAVSSVGATPVPVEPDRKTYNIDPTLISRAITQRTKAIMPVHLYGQPCEMNTIAEIAGKHGLYVVEDNAQSQGATFRGRITGSFGEISATSSYPGKNVGALGDAGAVTTDSEEFAKRAAVIRNYGSEKKYFNEEKGVNSRLDEMQAGFLNVKLDHVSPWNEERRKIANKYNERLKDVGDVILPKCHKDAVPVYHLYVIRTKHRDQLQQHLQKSSIGTLIHYPMAPHMQKAYSDLNFKKGDFPIAEEIADTCLSLPLYPGLTDDAIDYISDTISRFYQS